MSIGFNSSNGCLFVCLNGNVRQRDRSWIAHRCDLESHNQVELDYSNRMSVCVSIGLNSSNGCLSVCLKGNVRQRDRSWTAHRCDLESHNQVGLDSSNRMSVCVSIGLNSSNACLSVCLKGNVRQRDRSWTAHRCDLESHNQV